MFCVFGRPIGRGDEMKNTWIRVKNAINLPHIYYIRIFFQIIDRNLNIH
jgi:hypothetical protein